MEIHVQVVMIHHKVVILLIKIGQEAEIMFLSLRFI
jgi:hypothetical protein